MARWAESNPQMRRVAPRGRPDAQHRQQVWQIMQGRPHIKIENWLRALEEWRLCQNMGVWSEDFNWR